MRMETKKIESARLENQSHEFFLMGLVVALGFLFITFEWSTTEVTKHEIATVAVDPGDEIMLPVTIQKPLTPPAPAVAAPPRVVAPNIVITEKENVPDVELVPTDASVDEDLTAFVAPVEEDPVEDIVFAVCEKDPSFPGGPKAMMEFLSKNIKYPAVCLESGIQGRVFVSFVVDKDGKIVDVTVLKGVHEKLDAEAVRVVSSMPAWTPGEMQGRKVKARFQLPVNFRAVR